MAVMLLLPGSSIPKTDIAIIPYLDKIIHFILFAGLVFFWGLYLREKNMGKKWRIKLFALVILAIMFGVIIEFIQGYVIISRSFDTQDILANSLGAVFSAALITFLKGKD